MGRDSGSPLNPRCMLDTFVVGRSNDLAYAAIRRIAETNPTHRPAFTPLYVYGAEGLGKTHLLQGLTAARRASGSQPLYLNANDVQESLASRTPPLFLARQHADIVIIDDVQDVLSGRTGDAGCSALRALLESYCPVVMAADRAPSDFDLPRDIVSRLVGGLVTQITPMEMEVRSAILVRLLERAQAEEPTFFLSPVLLRRIATVRGAKGRQLEGIMNRLLAEHQLVGRPVTPDTAEDATRATVPLMQTKGVTLANILLAVETTYGISRAELLSARRARRVARPRQVMMYLAKELTPRSLPEIGRYIGNRDHTTVMHGVRKVIELMALHPAFAREVERLSRELQA